MQSQRLGKLPPYLFSEIDRLKESFRESGAEFLDLGIGDPDIGPSDQLVKALKEALDNPEFHRYPSGCGLPHLKNAIRDWVKKRYDIELKDKEILVTIGSKEAIGHLPLAVVNPGDVVLIPDPGYPVYNSSSIFAEAIPYKMPLIESKGYWPEFGKISFEVLEKSKLMFLNYPNNPTSAVANKDKFVEAVEFCRENDIIIANDAAYSEISFDYPVDLLFPVAKEADISYLEFFSFSKSLSIAGWRVGFAIGSEEVISALSKMKANIDSGVFSAIQEAIAVILDSDFEKITHDIMSIYRERRAILSAGLDQAGFDYVLPEATFYFWVKTPGDIGSMQFCEYLLKKADIICTPGVGFGKYGEGYIRLSLTADTSVIRRAAEGLAKISRELKNI
jgi:LL-diaminopimelate aminotransferase